LLPLESKAITGDDLSKNGEIKLGEFCQINKSSAIFWAPNGQRNRCEVFGAHDSHAMFFPFYNHGGADRFTFKAGRCTQELDGKSINQNTLLLEMSITKLSETLENWLKGDEKRARL